jgi:hypothetical protein
MRDAKLGKSSTDEPEAGDILRLRWGGRTRRGKALHREICPAVDIDRLLWIGLDMVENISEQLIRESLHLGNAQDGAKVSGMICWPEIRRVLLADRGDGEVRKRVQHSCPTGSTTEITGTVTRDQKQRAPAVSIGARSNQNSGCCSWTPTTTAKAKATTKTTTTKVDDDNDSTSGENDRN